MIEYSRFHNINFATSLHRMIATLLKRVCRIDIDISDGLCKLKYMINCCGPDVSSSHYRYYSPDSAYFLFEIIP